MHNLLLLSFRNNSVNKKRCCCNRKIIPPDVDAVCLLQQIIPTYFLRAVTFLVVMVRGARTVHQHVETNTGKLETTEEHGSDVGDAGDACSGHRGTATGSERKSTSGCGMTTMINGTVVMLWSRTQATRALSTPQSEYDSVVTECNRWYQTGRKAVIRTWTSSNASNAMAPWKGLAAQGAPR